MNLAKQQLMCNRICRTKQTLNLFFPVLFLSIFIFNVSNFIIIAVFM